MRKSMWNGIALALCLVPTVAFAEGLQLPFAAKHATLAVIGDTPYGDAQLADFPNLVTAINADKDVRTIVHVGDIKTGSSLCDTTYFESVRDLFATFDDALLYTPGDNEWTDCHRARAGKFDPLERLEVLRDTFYPVPGLSLGKHKRWVWSQAYAPGFGDFVENRLWVEGSAVMSILHVVGSNNGLAPWFADDATDALVDDPSRREAEVEARIEAALDWLDRTFFLAKLTRAPGVVLFMQADMWEANAIASGASLAGFDLIVQRLADLAAAYKRPVLVVQGDSHRFLVDKPLENGDPIHDVTVSAPNVTRLVVEGETSKEWLKLRIDARSAAVFSWERIVR